MIYQEYINDISLGAIHQNLLKLIFLFQIFSQLEQKWQPKPVEDHKNAFRQAQCGNWHILAIKNNYTQWVTIMTSPKKAF